MCACVGKGGGNVWRGHDMMRDGWVETAKIDHVSRAFADANGNDR